MTELKKLIADLELWCVPKCIQNPQTDLEYLIYQLDCMKTMIDHFKQELQETQKITHLKHLLSDIRRQFITPWHELCVKYQGDEIIEK